MAQIYSIPESTAEARQLFFGVRATWRRFSSARLDARGGHRQVDV